MATCSDNVTGADNQQGRPDSQESGTLRDCTPNVFLVKMKIQSDLCGDVQR